MKKKAVLLCCALGVTRSFAQSPTPLAPPTDTTTLEQTIQLTLEKNYAIQIARRNRTVAAQNNTLGNAGFFPNANLSGGLNNQYNLVSRQVFLNQPERNFDNTKNRSLNAAFNLNWTLFNGLGMFVARDQLGELDQQGADNLRLAVETTVAQVSSAYYQVAALQQRIRAFREAQDISAQRLKLAQAQYEIGTGTKLNFLAAQVDYNTDQATLINQEQLLQNARLTLNRLVNRALPGTFVVSNALPLPNPLDYAQLRDRTLSRNNSLLATQRSERIADLNTRLLNAQRYPLVTANGSYVQTQINNGAGLVIAQNSGVFVYGLTATVPLFGGFNQSRLIQNARLANDVARDQTLDLRVQLETALETTFLNYQTALRLIAFERANLNLAKQNVDIALDRYKIGVATFLELRDAQLNAVNTENRLIDARLNAKLAEIELLRLSSSLVTTP